MQRSLLAILAVAILFCTTGAAAQGLSLPPSGDNQKSSVSQNIGLVKVTIDYSSPDVHGPNGEDRRGKIYGQLVHFGMKDEDFGTCTECPWRAGANENTVFTVSHDVKIAGKLLPAGRYGLHMVVGPVDWTVIFSKNADSWGSYYYDPKEDQLRVSVLPKPTPYQEWLTYEFIERRPDRAIVAMKWEDVQLPIPIEVEDPAELYLTQIRKELRSSPGFQWQNWVNAAQYALQAKRPAEAVEFAQQAVTRQFIGTENYRTLSTLADAQEAAGKTADATATRNKALHHATASVNDLHQYGRQLLARGKTDEAVKVWELNAKRFPNVWPVHVGLARGYSAQGRYKDALKHARQALQQAPDDANKQNLTEAVKKLEAGKDMNV
jgi:tetratricopeptide (TPR) repeat protein